MSPSTAAAPHPERILIIKPSSLGDVVHALPALASLRAAYPNAHIAWLVSTSFAALLADHPLLDEVIVFDRRRYGRMLRSPRAALDFLGFVRDLRRRRFDLVLDLQGLFRSGFLSWTSGARRRVGFSAARELAWLFYTDRVRCPDVDAHAVDKNARLLRAVLPDAGAPTFPLGLRNYELRGARQLLATSDGLEAFTAIVPGARWETKQWSADRWAEVIDGLNDAGLPTCVLLGGPDDRTLAAEIEVATRATTLNLVGRTTLRELIAVLSLAGVVVCHDSGPMHLAAALGRPLVAVFGPTSPARTGPYGDTARVVSLGLDCAPCYRRRCPLDHQACLRDLPAATVVEQVRELWAQARTQAGD